MASSTTQMHSEQSGESTRAHSRRSNGQAQMSAAELRQVLHEFNDTAMPYPENRLIHQLFEDQVHRTPQAVALIDRESSVTYADLNARANQVARYLRDKGIGPDRLVGICLERSLELIISLLGVLKAGGAYVPLDPSYPIKRLDYMLRDSAPRILLTQERLRSALPAMAAELVAVDSDWTEISRHATDNIDAAALQLTPRHLAYVIYTSGSTGEPKGVAAEHRSTVNRIMAQTAIGGYGSDDICCHKTSIGFVDAVFEIMGPLSYGRPLVLAPPEAARDVQLLAALIEQERVTRLVTVPSLARSLIADDRSVRALQTLRNWTLSGEELKADLLRLLQQRLPECTFTNLYGSSEVAADVTCHVSHGVEDGAVPIGRPIANARIYILDRDLQPVPVGVPGEIHIGGACLARGYLNRPGLTAERFIADPFAGDRSARIYKSGDLGQWRADGTIEYLGRNDQQIKLRGFRVEMREVEAQLVRHPAVEEAAVVVREESGEKRLVAYLTAREGHPSVDDLRAHMRTALPDYMVPNAFVILDKLPLTPSGKLDRSALPAPEPAAYANRPFESPLGEVEEAVAAVWQELLPVQRVGRRDNFFELGGHSLLIVQLIRRLHELGLAAQARNVYENPILADLARALARGATREPETVPALIPPACEVITPRMLPLVQLETEHIERIVCAVPGGAANVQDIYPLAPLQEGLLFHHLLDQQGSDTYVLVTLMSMASRQRLEDFIASLQAVIDRHDVLRTAVLWEQLSQPVQVVCRQASLPVEEFVLDRHADPISQLKRHVSPERLRMDLRKAPLMHLHVAADPHGPAWYAALLLHHIVGDDATQEIVISEAMAHLQGRATDLQKPAAYRNHVARALAHARANDADAFFRSRLSHVDEPTAPFGLLDVRGGSSHFEVAHQRLDASLARSVRAQARRHGVSAATLFHAAWALVVARLSGRDDVVFGTVLLGRLQAEVDLQRAPGMFINTLPLRLALQGLSASRLVEETQRELTQLLNHEQASLAVAQRCSGIQGSAPLFTALLNYRHGAPDVAAGAAGIQVLASQDRTHYPITLSVDDDGDGFALTSQTDPRVDPQRITAYLQVAMRSLVEALDCAAQTSVLQLQILPRHELDQVTRAFNDTYQVYPQDALIHELFEEQVLRTPDAVAAVCDGDSLTYSELNGKANQLARYLLDQGVGPDDLVGLCLERNLNILISLLGILKAGGAYVPLDPNYPRQRLAYMLRDASPRVLLTQQQYVDRLPDPPAVTVLLDRDWERIAEKDAGNPDARALGLHSNHLAYVIYTSGSTGRPKGVEIEHRNTVNLICWACSAATAQTFDRTLLSTSLNFDLSVYECFVPLSTGGSVHVVENALALTKAAADVTLLNTVPSAISSILDSGGIPLSARTVNLAGEALKQDVVERIFASSEVERVCNLYGPSETTTYSTWICMARESGFSASIGRPIANTQVYVLDRQQQAVPIGVAGEIHIGGAGVVRGYRNRPELTAERFVADPFSHDPAARMYQTGDVGRWLPDGSLEYLGRNDHQVKIRGYRIELGEIEAQLARHSEVKEAAVLAREDAPGEKRLVAYVTPRDRGNPNAEELRAHLKSALPEHMVPSAFVVLERLPLTPNGKLDRAALPAPHLGAFASQEYQPPQGEVEEILAGIWQELLRLERVGRQDNFFELGGHSLLIVQMLERLRRMGLSSDLRSIFGSPTLSDLAASLTNHASAGFQVPPNLIPPGCGNIVPQMLPLVDLEASDIERIAAAVPGGAINIQDIYPLAPLQEGMLFHHLLDRQGGDTYVVATLLSLSSQERLEQLTAALQAVIDRHDMLRTAVLWEQLPQPVQVVYRSASLPVQGVVLDRAQDPARQIEDWLKPERLQMDLRRAPLMKLQVAAAPDGRWYALLQMHHIVDDDISLKILIQEIVAHLQGHAKELPQPGAYRNHVAQSLEYARTHDAASFFRSKLGDIEQPTAPFGLLDVHGDGSRIEEANREIDPALARRLRLQARRLNVSVATMFHAAWALVVGSASGRDDVVFGSVLLGRLHGSAGAQRIVGMFVNTLPLRLRLRNATAKELVEQTQRELVQLLSHEQASLAMAQRCSGMPGSMPLFSAVLNYRHSVPDPQAEWASAAGVQMVAHQYRTNYPLGLSVDDLGDGFALTALAQRRIDPRRVIGYMQEALRSLTDALERSPRTPVLSLSVLPQSERHQVVDLFNATLVDYPRHKLVHQLFEEQAARTPDAPAVLYEQQSITYAQLNARANQLARHLCGHGVGPDDLVGLYVGRGVEMIVGLIAVLKAGGAYVPLDPDYPSRRLAHILESARPKVLLLQQRLRAQVPDTAATIVALDGDWDVIARESAENLDSVALGMRASDLAYVIYTSGSTGQPKGVMIEHRNLTSLWQGLEVIYRATPCWRVAVNASFNFDASVKQFVQLLSGRTLVPIPQEVRWDAARLLDFIAEHRVDAVDCTPSQLKPWIAAGLLDRGRNVLRLVLVGGEPIDTELWNSLAQCAEIDFYNVYGPTESTVDATFARLQGDSTMPHIGRPMQNRRVYILDRDTKPVPIGATGEMYIGGAGVARGYLRHPELTAERFVADPFDPQARAYRTGDLGRWRPDGTIEYVGRDDHQVKIRGFRIELGEIEAQLLQHPQVKEAAVVAYEDESRERRLVAYVAADMQRMKALQQASSQEASAEMVAQWNKVHDETYAAGPGGPSFVGWNSSYTGQPIPQEQMEEWLGCTIERISALQPTRVLEIGCGVGLLLQHLAPKCSAYVGTDFAAAALEQLRGWMRGRADLEHVELLHRSATELRDLPAASFDLVVLNSVVQYFPDIEYLMTVLQESARLLAPGGKIFIGDVRHLGLLQMFHSAVQLSKAAASVTVGQLRKRIARAVAQEKELVIDPQFFHALPGRMPSIGAADVQLKRGRFANELTRYRYDVILHVGHRGARPGEPHHGQAMLPTMADLESALSGRRWPALIMDRIPNLRLAREAAALRLIETADEWLEAGALRRQLNEMPVDAVDPETFWQAGDKYAYEVRIDPAAQDRFAVQLRDRQSNPVPFSVPVADPLKAWNAYANEPVENGLRQQLIPQLREHLKGRLPEYMLPSAWMVLKQLPLTPNGKVDRRALPAPQMRGEELGDYVAPQSEVERALADIWGQVLQVDQIGLNDNFFEIGGHSLLAMQVMVRLRSSLSIEMPMSALFECPSIRQLAALVEDLRQASVLDDIEDGSAEMEELLERVVTMSESRAAELMRELRTRAKS